MGIHKFRRMSQVALLAAAGVCMLALSTSAQEAVTANVIFDTENAVGASSTGLRSVSAYRQRGDSSLVSDGLEDPVYEVDIPVDQQGYYRVYAWWPQVAGDSDGGLVRYEITADAAVESITLEQGGREGQWVRLGDFPVMRSDKLALKVSSGGPGSMAVDAFRLEYLGLTAPPLVITTRALELATRGQPYALTLEASGASTDLVWMAANALPRGLQLDPATGELSGSPEEAGVYTLEIHASQQDGDSASAELELVVVAPAPSVALDSIGISATRLADVTQAGAADGHSLLDEVAAMPEGSWQRVNMNLFSDAWTPAGLRTPKGSGATVPTPHKLISAWSSFAWDYHTGTMFLYGGGHANYAGNDVYLWRSATRMWERASLPSEVIQNDLGTWQAIDGPMAAPNSSHTYDNNVYLPVARRFMIYGGAAFDNGGAFTIQTGPDTERPTGPYVFDPSLADPWQVGGTTGSHVQRVAPYPEVTGGEMWSNRDIYTTIPGSPELPSNYVMGVTAVVIENGNDVIYVNAKTGGSARQLFKHTIRDIDDPTRDTFEKVGRFSSAFGKQAAGAYSASDNVFVRAGETLTYWDLDTAGTGNRNQLFVPADPSGEFEFSFNYGLDYSPVTEVFYLWGGGSTVWRLVPPELMSADGWVLQRESFAGGDAPYDGAGTGILGKWKFARDLNAFVALQDPDQGNVWIYKPAGWQAPGAPNQAPSVALSAPLEGAVFNLGEIITLAAEADDADGSVTAVQFYNGSALLGAATEAPYSFTWNNAPAGAHELSARAFDDGGAMTRSSTVGISVVSDNLPPQVALTSPVEGESISFGLAVGISASATDADGDIARVEFYQGATLLGTDLSAPYSYNWQNAPVGSHQLQARAIDDNGAAGMSETVAINVVDDNLPPTVSLVAPVSGELFILGDEIVLSAAAADSDGSIASVTFLHGDEVLFEDTVAPFRYSWNTAPLGSITLTARAFDDRGASTTSAPAVVTVASQAGGSLVTLQQGLDGYDATRDSYLTSSHPNLMNGGATILQDKTNRYRNLIGFSIFQSEGGPIPDGAIIDSAILGLYKYSSYDHNYGLYRLLQPWDEATTNWHQRQAGVLWSEPGAAGSGVDYAPVADANAYVGWSPGWLEFDITDPVQGISLGQANNGWLLLGLSGNKNTKRFYSSESNAGDELRPKLVVSYSFGGNLPPSVSMTSPSDGASFAEGTDIFLGASANDVDGTVGSVLFYDGDTLLFEDRDAPYEYNWTGAPVGRHSLTAQAIDDAGGIGDSAPLNIEILSENAAPTVALVGPTDGDSFLQGDPITLRATASDSDGAVSRVDFYNDGALLASDFTAPYEYFWGSAPVGNLSLTAVAVDNEDAQATSSVVSVSVSSVDGSIETVLQYGNGGYIGARDAYLSAPHPDRSFGGNTQLMDRSGRYRILLDFAIFQSEGGPVPDGATIESAVLGLYKYSSYDHVYRIYPLLADWDENSATWNQRQAGLPWAVAGAQGEGQDYTSTDVSNAITGWSPGWMEVDVTGSVQAIAQGAENHGWLLDPVSGNPNLKRFYSKEYATDNSVRPTLRLRYR